MWAVRHRLLLGILLMTAGLFAGFGLAELLEGRVPIRRVAVALLGVGTTILAGDMTIRTLGGEGVGVRRYLSPFTGPVVPVEIPLWLIGIASVVLGSWLAVA